MCLCTLNLCVITISHSLLSLACNKKTVWKSNRWCQSQKSQTRSFVRFITSEDPIETGHHYQSEKIPVVRIKSKDTRHFSFTGLFYQKKKERKRLCCVNLIRSTPKQNWRTRVHPKFKCIARMGTEKGFVWQQGDTSINRGLYTSQLLNLLYG